MINVDQNETHKELATKINVEGSKNVLNTCKKIDSKLFFMSTDFIYDGIEKDGDCNENYVPNPLNHYRKTKYKAENTIINSEVNFCICKTAVLYGWNPQKLNFITWILDKLYKKEKISIITSQINNATFVKNLSEILWILIEKDVKGIYHTAGEGALSRYEMALKCAEIFDYDKELIFPIEDFKQKAIRPKNVGLNIDKMKSFLGSDFKVFGLEDGLKDMKQKKINIDK